MRSRTLFPDTPNPGDALIKESTAQNGHEDAVTKTDTKEKVLFVLPMARLTIPYSRPLQMDC